MWNSRRCFCLHKFEVLTICHNYIYYLEVYGWNTVCSKMLLKPRIWRNGNVWMVFYKDAYSLHIIYYTNTLLLICRKAYIITICDYAIIIIFLYPIQLVKDKHTPGGGAKSYDREKAWSATNHSILSWAVAHSLQIGVRSFRGLGSWRSCWPLCQS